MSGANQPLVSVVVATYNGERFIREQLESILSQTYSNIEIVVVDDSSTDNTLTILREYQARHTNFSIVENEQNIGYVKTFERGMAMASGDYIAPSDQDDIWERDKISFLMGEVGDNEIVYSNSTLIDDAGNDLGRKLSDIKRLVSFDDCLNYSIGNTAPGHAMIVTKGLVERCFPFPTMIPHDYWLGFVATCKMPIKFVDKTLIRYRQHSQNVFGAVKVQGEKRIKKKLSKQEQLQRIRERMHFLYMKCPDDLTEQKKVLRQLDESYRSFSLSNNFKRMAIFFRYRKRILKYKNKSDFRKWLFCFKMFYKIK